MGDQKGRKVNSNYSIPNRFPIPMHIRKELKLDNEGIAKYYNDMHEARKECMLNYIKFSKELQN